MCSFLTCKRTRFSSTHFLRFPGFQPSAGTLPVSGYSGIRGGGRCYSASSLYAPAGGNQRPGTGKPELPGQRADIADCGDLTVEYGIYRKSHRFSEAKRDPTK